MSHLQTYSPYPHYFFAILLYEGLPVSEKNLYILHMIEQEAFEEYFAYEGVNSYQNIQQNVCKMVINNLQNTREKLICGQEILTCSAELHYALVGMIDGIPHFLLEPNLVFNNQIKPTVLQRVFRSFRPCKSGYEWVDTPQKCSFLISEPTARTIKAEVDKYEKTLFWNQTQNIKVVSLHYTIMNHFLR